MTTFSGNAAGYRVDVLANGKIRVVDIDSSDGDSGKQILAGDDTLSFADREYQLTAHKENHLSTSADSETVPVATGLSGGGYVMAWESGYTAGVRLQGFDAEGNKIGGEFTLTSPHNNEIFAYPNITALTDGGYLLTWCGTEVRGEFSPGIFAQRFDAAGNTVGSKFIVNSQSTAFENYSDAVGLADGGFVVTWQSTDFEGYGAGVHAQRFDAEGQKVGEETFINIATSLYRTTTAIAALDDGGYILTWAQPTTNHSNNDIYARRFDASGEPVGSEILITPAEDYAYQHDITGLNGGGYAISWHVSNGTTGANAVYAQLFDADGNKVGAEVKVDAGSSAYTKSHSITALPDGGYLLTWEYGVDSDKDILAQRYDAAGNAEGDQIHVSTDVQSNHASPSVTALSDGGYVISWLSFSTGDFILCSRTFDADGTSATTGVLLTGTENDDTVQGGSGIQIIHAAEGNDTLFGRNGDDVLDGQGGNDHMLGGSGNDRLYGGLGSDILNGGGGNDILRGGSAYDYDDAATNTLYGGEGNDVLYAGMGGTAILNGGAGDDILYSDDSENCIMNGGDGNDLLDNMLTANATLSGGAGNDTLHGGGDGTILNGGDGDDVLYSSPYSNGRLFGGAGNDILDAGNLGEDVLNGGTGSDIFLIAARYSYQGVHTIEDFSAAEGDVIQLSQAAFKKLGYTGVVSASNFTANANGVALDADDYFIYETDTGNFYYDSNGNGSGKKALYLTLGVDSHPELAATDLRLI